MNPFIWVGAAGAALLTGIAIMLKGRIIDPQMLRATGGGIADSRDVPGITGSGALGEEEDPFKRHLLDEGRAGAEGPAPTQARTAQLSNGFFGASSAEPSVSYSSAGDFQRMPAPVRQQAAFAPSQSTGRTEAGFTSSAPGSHGTSPQRIEAGPIITTSTPTGGRVPV